jgi:hypothetical protein
MPGDQMASLGAMFAGSGGARGMPSHVVKSLGKIAKWSPHTPRQLLAEAGSTATPGEEPEPKKGAEEEPSTPRGASAKEARDFPLRVRGKIEVAMGALYELEEMDRAEQLPDSADPTQQAEAAKQAEERKAHAEKLVAALELRASTTVTPCKSADEILEANPGDEYFAAMCTLPKGRRLLRRSIPLLVPEFGLELFCTVFRNIGVLQYHKSPETVSTEETAETMSFFMTLAHTLVQLGAGAAPLTHASLVKTLTARFPAHFLPRVLGSQIGATMLVSTARLYA